VPWRFFVWIELHAADPFVSAGSLPHPHVLDGQSERLFWLLRRRPAFMLVIWLQGIWLPLHGYSFARDTLWAGIYMTPLMFGFI